MSRFLPGEAMPQVISFARCRVCCRTRLSRRAARAGRGRAPVLRRAWPDVDRRRFGIDEGGWSEVRAPLLQKLVGIAQLDLRRAIEPRQLGVIELDLRRSEVVVDLR